MTAPNDSQKNKETNIKKVAIYGGNGFVGTQVAKHLYQQGVCAIALSRSGHKPLHIQHLEWGNSVRWCKGDASAPDPQLLESIDSLVLAVGSPPLPTWSKESYAKQLFMNGTANVNAIEAATDAGVKQIILVSAKIPWIINTDKFAYAKGKRLAYEAANNFTMLSKEHSATVLKPGAIFGKRYTRNGKMIPLDIIMEPLSKIMPWQFVSVDSVAKCVANIVVGNNDSKGFNVIENRDI